METIICDGELVIVKITPDLYDQAIELYQKYFMKYENISISANLLGSQQTIDDMELLIRAILVDGVSFAALNRKTREMAAFCVNKILNPSKNLSLNDCLEKMQSSAMQHVGSILERMEGSRDLFAEWQIDSAFEIMFLSTRHDYAQRGLATTLSRHAIAYARQMQLGTLPPDDVLPEHVRDERPQAVCSLFTTLFTQKLGRKLDFEVITTVSCKEFIFEGKTMAELIDPETEFLTFAALRL